MKSKKVSKEKWLSDADIIAMYEKWCGRNGFVYKIPSSPLHRSKAFAYLSNNNGRLARFNLKNHRFETDYRVHYFE